MQTQGYIVEWLIFTGMVRDVFFQSNEIANKTAARAISHGYPTAMRRVTVGDDGRLIHSDRLSSFHSA